MQQPRIGFQIFSKVYGPSAHPKKRRYYSEELFSRRVPKVKELKDRINPPPHQSGLIMNACCVRLLFASQWQPRWKAGPHRKVMKVKELNGRINPPPHQSGLTMSACCVRLLIASHRQPRWKAGPQL
jgi:hypothetical protein